MRRSLLVVVVVALAGCTATGTTSVPETTVPSVESTSTTAAGSTTTTAEPTTDGTDLLTYLEGVTVASWSGPESTNPRVALQLIDGDPAPVTLAVGDPGTVEIVFALPAPTTFERFSIPLTEATSRGTTGFATVAFAGSPDGPDEGFIELASGDLPAATGDLTDLDLPVTDGTAVRWLRVILEGTQSPADDRNQVEFTEISGFGTQEERPLSEGFNGLFELLPPDRPDGSGERLELAQTGAIVSGCLDSIPIRGVVNGPVAKLTGEDGTSSVALVLVADDSQPTAGALSIGNRRFQSRVAVSAEGDTRPSQCELPPEEEAVCETPLYVNFALDSAEIRSESDGVIDDIYRILTQLGIDTVTVEGHTSMEGSEEHNQVLSEERSQAVADALVERGYPESGITVTGYGETRPLITPDDDEASRAINRRVELVCGT